MQFGQKTAVVTGGASGIGQALCVALSEQRFRVAIMDTDSKGMKKTISMMAFDKQKDVLALTADVSDPDSVRDSFARITETFGKIDVLVNCAAVYETYPIEDLTEDAINRIFGTNLHGVFLCTQEAAKCMKGTGGSIVIVSSDAAFRGRPGHSAFSASKGALTAFTQSVAYQLGEYGIRVNMVSPGIIDTPSGESLRYQQEKRENRIRHTPMKRIGTAEDVTKAILFLLSDSASFITAASLTVDGGASVYLSGVDF